MHNPIKKNKASKNGPKPAAPAVPSEGADAAVDPAAVAVNLAKPKKALKAAPATAGDAAGAASPAAKADSGTAAKASKVKLVRGSFALPKDEYAALADLKKACEDTGAAVKKSQLLRVAIMLLRDLDAGRLAQMVAALPATKALPAKKSR